MASSISSERAFSQGGITTSKRHNRLKGDIVETLQCIKCALRHDLLFREPGPSSSTEELDDFRVEIDLDQKASEDDVEEEGWEDFLVEEDEDDIESDF